MVINASWGDYQSYPFNDILRDHGDSAQWNALGNAIASARDAPNGGIIFVAACGNNGHNNDSHPLYPASYNQDNVIAVAATDENDTLAIFPPDNRWNCGRQSNSNRITERRPCILPPPG